MQGNIARWLKKEGDKVSPGEVLCEVETVGFSFWLLVEFQPLVLSLSGFALPVGEIWHFPLVWYQQDKATVEMECMEEGYLAKIVKGDGSKEIKVGEVLILSGRCFLHVYVQTSLPLSECFEHGNIIEFVISYRLLLSLLKKRKIFQSLKITVLQCLMLVLLQLKSLLLLPLQNRKRLKNQSVHQSQRPLNPVQLLLKIAFLLVLLLGIWLKNIMLVMFSTTFEIF